MLVGLVSSDVNGKVTSISSKTNNANCNTLADLIKFKKDKDISFDLWKIKYNGETLVRIINGKESELVISYMYCDNTHNERVYSMINGHTFGVKFDSKYFYLQDYTSRLVSSYEYNMF